MSRLPRPALDPMSVRHAQQLHDRGFVAPAESIVLLLRFFVPPKRRREFVGIGERILFGRRQGVICVCRHGHRRARATERVTDRVIVSVTADEYANRGRVGLPAEPVIDQGDVKTKLAGMFGLELAGFQFDDHVPELLDVEEQQVEIEVIAGYIEVDLASHECETCAQFSKGVDDAVHQRLFQVAFDGFFRQLEEIEHVGVFGDLPGQVGVGGCQLGTEVRGRGAGPFEGSVLG